MEYQIKRKAHLVRIAFMTIIIISSYLMFVRLIGDFGFHLASAGDLNKVGLRAYLSDHTYPLWHMLVAGLIRLGVPGNHSAALVTSICNGATFFLVDYYLIKRLGNELPETVLSFLAATLLFVGPFYIPWYNENLYLGQGSPNVWHNPTNLCVRPFAVLSFFLLVEIVEQAKDARRDKKLMMIAGAVLLISILAKPSWLQVFIPGVMLYLCLLFLSKKENKLYIMKTLALLVFVSLIPLVIAAWKIFWGQTAGGGDGGAYIAPFLVMKIYAPNVLLSLCLGYLFPIFVAIVLVVERIVKKRPISSDIAIMWCLLVAALGENILLAERGREGHGNFGWGAQLMQFISYVVALKEYVKLYTDGNDSRIRQAVLDSGFVIYLIQFAVGLYWYYRCMFFW